MNMNRTVMALALAGLTLMACGTAQAEVALSLSSYGQLVDSGGNPVGEGTQTIAVVDRDNDGLVGFDLNNAPSDSFLFDSDDWIVSDYLDGVTWDEGTGAEVGGVSLPSRLSSDNDPTGSYSFLLESDGSGDGTAGINPGDAIHLFYFPGLDASAAEPGAGQAFGMLTLGEIPNNGGGLTLTAADTVPTATFGTTAVSTGQPIPEPASGLLLVLGGAGLAANRRRRNRASA